MSQNFTPKCLTWFKKIQSLTKNTVVFHWYNLLFIPKKTDLQKQLRQMQSVLRSIARPSRQTDGQNQIKHG